MDGKKIAFAVVLAIIIGGAVVSIVRTTSTGTPKPKAWVLEREVEKIDKESGELMTKPVGEWLDIGHNGRGTYKNPNTGAYTMVTPMKCASCGGKIAPPDMSEVDLLPDNDPKALREYQKIIGEFVCPKCGKKAYGGM